MNYNIVNYYAVIYYRLFISKELFHLKKSIAILLILAVCLTSGFAACAKKDKGSNEEGTVAESSNRGLNDADTEVDFVEVEVTDKNGEKVTDKNGKVKTEEVPVVITRDKNGKPVAHRIDKEGNTTPETVPYSDPDDDNTTTKKGDKGKTTTKKKTTAKSTTMTTKGDEKTTAPEPTTKKTSGVPTTNDSGTKVEFSAEDQTRVKRMLEVPYLYKASYENAQGVPINIASHAAIWMAEKDGLQPSTFASGTIVLGLFKYFGQTVVNFKADCNSKGDNENIKFNSTNGTFAVTAFETADHTVTLTSIEDLGNNYFKVTASVSGGGKSKVVAIMQKNKLDLDLGFSVKALKWS